MHKIKLNVVAILFVVAQLTQTQVCNMEHVMVMVGGGEQGRPKHNRCWLSIYGPNLHLSSYHPTEATWGSISAAAVVFVEELVGQLHFEVAFECVASLPTAMGVCCRRALAGRIDCYWQYNRTFEISQRRVDAQVPWQRVLQQSC